MSKWISVEKELPDEGTDVLVQNRGFKMSVASFNPSCRCTGKWHGGANPTHWQPLPAPPKVENPLVG